MADTTIATRFPEVTLRVIWAGPVRIWHAHAAALPAAGRDLTRWRAEASRPIDAPRGPPLLGIIPNARRGFPDLLSAASRQARVRGHLLFFPFPELRPLCRTVLRPVSCGRFGPSREEVERPPRSAGTRPEHLCITEGPLVAGDLGRGAPDSRGTYIYDSFRDLDLYCRIDSEGNVLRARAQGLPGSVGAALPTANGQ